MKTWLVVVMLLVSTPAFAINLEWNRNSEADMRDYNVYVCQVAGCTVQPIASAKVGTVVQPAVGVIPKFTLAPTFTVGAVAVTAVDTSGNESALSNTVFFDVAPPGAPSGLVKK